MSASTRQVRPESNIEVVETELDSPSSITYRTVLLHSLCFVLFAPVLTYLTVFHYNPVADIVRKSRKLPVKDDPRYKDPNLVKKAIATPVAQAYIAGGLEFQRVEGYCASATMRCILKSIPRIPPEDVPASKRAPSIPPAVMKNIDEASKGITKSTIVYGIEGYDAFMEAIKKSNDVHYRIAVNFLRSPLNGFAFPWLYPKNFIFGLFGGHFSPILGYLAEEDLVAVFDVNHKMGGLCLIPSRRLFDAVNTNDIFQAKGVTRGLVVTEILEQKIVKYSKKIRKLSLGLGRFYLISLLPS